ncbi:MAG: hypothetical protein VKO64_09385 [Candidatus Sericytochromatia bacterium]|nr:hypothetical protein [Candidatus Sericytochromatia bacterium]
MYLMAIVVFSVWLLLALLEAVRQYRRIGRDRRLVEALRLKVDQQVLLISQEDEAAEDAGEIVLACGPDGAPFMWNVATQKVVEGFDLSKISIDVSIGEDKTLVAKDQDGNPVEIVYFAPEDGDEDVEDDEVSLSGAEPVDRGADASRQWVRDRLSRLLASEGLTGSRLSKWVEVLHQAQRVGGQVNPSAYLDAVWNQERESLRWMRFWSRNAVLLGLVFTSLSLSLTLAELEPVFAGAAGQTFDDASKSIQTALAHSLQPMGLAFRASFAGLVLTLVLGLLTDWLSKVQDAYIEELDRFLQGLVIPHFSARVEDARNEYLGFALLRMEGILEQMSTQHAEVVGELANLGPSLTESAKIMKSQLSSFSRSLKVLEKLAEQASTAGQEIRRSLDEGYATLRASHDHFVGDLEAWLKGAVEPQLQELRRQSASWDSFRGEAAQSLGRAGQSIDEIVGASHEAHRIMAALGEALEGARMQWLTTTMELSGLPDRFNERLVDAGARVVADSVKKHEQQVTDLNRQIGDRFSDLIRALGAALGS